MVCCPYIFLEILPGVRINRDNYKEKKKIISVFSGGKKNCLFSGIPSRFNLYSGFSRKLTDIAKWLGYIRRFAVIKVMI